MKQSCASSIVGLSVSGGAARVDVPRGRRLSVLGAISHNRQVWC